MKISFAIQLLCHASALKIDTMKRHHHHQSLDYAQTDKNAYQSLNEQWTPSFAQKEVEAGCCQRSKDDTRCASWDYHKGVCIKLYKKNIGCNRALWVPGATFNEETKRCEPPTAEKEKEANPSADQTK